MGNGRAREKSNIMKKAQEEVRRVVGKKSKVDETDITQMQYLQCIMKETLRLHTPIPLLGPRQTSTSVKLEGYDIPPKMTVYVNIWANKQTLNYGTNQKSFSRRGS